MNARHVVHDVLDWWDRNRPDQVVVIAAICVFVLWVIGGVFAGEPVDEPAPAPSVYVHPEAVP